MSNDRTIAGMTPRQVCEMSGDDLQQVVDQRVKTTLEEMGMASAQPKVDEPNKIAQGVSSAFGLLLALIVVSLSGLKRASVWTAGKAADKAKHEWGLFREGRDMAMKFVWATIVYGGVMGAIGLGGAKLYQMNPEAFGWIVTAFKAITLI